MATPATRETLKQYALRALGKPVIEINVDDYQLEDRLDEALQYFSQYHYDGIKRAYLKYQYTSGDKARITVIHLNLLLRIQLLHLGYNKTILLLFLNL